MMKAIIGEMNATRIHAILAESTDDYQTRRSAQAIILGEIAEIVRAKVQFRGGQTQAMRQYPKEASTGIATEQNEESFKGDRLGNYMEQYFMEFFAAFEMPRGWWYFPMAYRTFMFKNAIPKSRRSRIGYGNPQINRLRFTKFLPFHSNNCEPLPNP
jgi:hypothetical protein